MARTIDLGLVKGARDGGDADTLNGKSAEYYTNPLNLSVNSNFRNPVNQRGVTEWSSGYGIDKWIVYNMTATVVSNGLWFHNLIDGVDHVFQQRLPLKTLNRAKQYTAAMCSTDGGVIFGVVNMLNDGFDEISFYLDSENTYEYVVIYEGEYTADNLPPYVPKGYAVELAECQRYFVKYPAQFAVSGVCNSETQLRLYLADIVKLRDGVTPTASVSSNGGTIFKVDGGYGLSEVLSSLTISGGLLVVSLSSAVLNVNTPASVLFSGELSISADL